jgi:hypothetical protein
MDKEQPRLFVEHAAIDLALHPDGRVQLVRVEFDIVWRLVQRSTGIIVDAILRLTGNMS